MDDRTQDLLTLRVKLFIAIVGAALALLGLYRIFLGS
jgi:hypothetical protein